MQKQGTYPGLPVAAAPGNAGFRRSGRAAPAEGGGAPPPRWRSSGMPEPGQSGFSICLWQYSQSPLMVEPSPAVCESSWQRKQPFDVVWPRLSG
jgi:hypothetical protein